MSWAGWSEFVAMGGYARYVWGSVLVFLVAIVGEWITLGRRRHAALQALEVEAADAGGAAP